LPPPIPLASKPKPQVSDFPQGSTHVITYFPCLMWHSVT
jgi:hypothetical protein